MENFFEEDVEERGMFGVGGKSFLTCVDSWF